MDLLAVGAHPDDVELTCGGTVALVARKREVGILDLTEGEASTRGTVEERRVEAQRAAEILGVVLRRNALLPDTGVDSTSKDHIDAVVDILRELKPRVILAPYRRSAHPDHSEASSLIQRAFVLARIAGFRSTHGAHRPEKLYFYDALGGMLPNFVVDMTDAFETKMEAIRVHRSQVEPDPDPTKKPVTPISDPTFLEGIAAVTRYWGFRTGVRHAEPFLAREPFVVSDPSTALIPRSDL